MGRSCRGKKRRRIRKKWYVYINTSRRNKPLGKGRGLDDKEVLNRPYGSRLLRCELN
jgi:hypothetical protein